MINPKSFYAPHSCQNGRTWSFGVGRPKSVAVSGFLIKIWKKKGATKVEKSGAFSWNLTKSWFLMESSRRLGFYPSAGVPVGSSVAFLRNLMKSLKSGLEGPSKSGAFSWNFNVRKMCDWPGLGRAGFGRAGLGRAGQGRAKGSRPSVRCLSA